MNDVAVISGASKGIGRITAFELAKKGINLALLARSYQVCKQIANKIEKETKVQVLPILTDLTIKESIKNAVKNIMDKFGRIDYLINLAGYPLDLKLWKKKVHEIEEEEINQVMNVDFFGTFRLVKECLPIMMKQKKGVIVNVASIPAISGDLEGTVYSLAKSLNIILTKNIAIQYGEYNIRAYTIALGSIRTRSTYYILSKKERKRLALETSLKRWGEPIEIAKLISSLISENFSFVTGQTIIADGGVVMI
jgi:3-oxoacyl-[acyl-carrier protein] reductase